MRNRLVALAFLLAAGFAHADSTTTVNVSNTTATAVAPLTCTTCKTVRVENGGSNDIFCAPSISVTTSTGAKVAAGGWQSFPNVPIWCIAATAAQTGTARDLTIVWLSDS